MHKTNTPGGTVVRLCTVVAIQQPMSLFIATGSPAPDVDVHMFELQRKDAKRLIHYALYCCQGMHAVAKAFASAHSQLNYEPQCKTQIEKALSSTGNRFALLKQPQSDHMGIDSIDILKF